MVFVRICDIYFLRRIFQVYFTYYISSLLFHVYFTYLILFYFVFQLQAERRMTDVSHGRKFKFSALSLSLPVDDNHWFWEPVDRSDLRPLLLTGYESISHGLVCAMAERWHKETNSFHLPVVEMTITLDDVACLLHIPIVGQLIEKVNHLLFPMEETVEQVSNNSGVFVTYTAP